MHLQGNFENNLAEAFNLMNTGKLNKATDLFENLTENILRPLEVSSKSLCIYSGQKFHKSFREH